MTRKLTFLILALFALIAGPGWGQTVTFNPTVDKSSTNSLTKGNITISITDGTLNNGTDYRVFKNQSMTITSTEGAITEIALTYTSASYDGGGWASSFQPNDDSWTSPTANGEQARITQIVVTYSAGDTPSITVTDNVTLDYDATEGQFDYSISNPATGVNMTASTEDNWISNITVNESNVAFTTTENEAQTQRVGTITLSYTGATSKDVTVTQAAAPEEGLLFYESFDTNNGTGGNDGQWSGSIASKNLESDNEDWTFVKGNGAKQCAKFGTASAKGSATTPSISYNGDATLTFKAAAWNGSSESTTLNISATNATLSQAAVTLAKGAWTEYSINITNVTNSTQITFEANNASNNRFFLDEVKVLEAEAPSVATPTFNPVAGTYNEAQSVSIVCANEGAAIYYTLDGTEPSNSSTPYTDAITISETTTIKAIAYFGNEASNVATAVYTIISIPTYASLAELIDAGEPTTEGTQVNVTLTDETITGIFTTTQGYRNGIFLQVENQEIEIYCHDVPEDWVIGGTVSGTLENCTWKKFNSTWELCPDSWDDLDYTAPQLYSITIYPSAFSEVTTSPADEAAAGTEVTITISNIEEHYHISEITVYDSYDNLVSVDDNGKFTMPESDVSISVTFLPDPQFFIHYYSNGSSDSFEIVYAGPIGELREPSELNFPEGFTFAGWSTSMASTTAITGSYYVTANTDLFAIFARVEGGTTGSGNYEKVTSALTDWRGDYLIAYSDEVFMDGSLAGGTDGVGAANSSVAPETALTANTITAAWGDQHYVTIEAIDDNDLSKGYVIKSHSETTPYFYQTSNTNGMASTNNKATAAAYPISIVFNDENDIDIALGGEAAGAVLHYNATGTGHMFRFYKDGGQSPVYLYKKSTGTPGITKYYTRVFQGHIVMDDITIEGPSIISAGSTLNMDDYTLTNTNPANLIIEDGGQLIHHNAGVQATMRKEVTAYSTTEGVNNGWYFVASPMAALTSHNLNNGTYDLYKFEQSADKEWKNYESTAFSITNKEGYLYANAANTAIEFVGTLNATDGSKTLAYADVRFAGFNLIGNPFACNANIGTQDFYICNGENIILAENSTIAPCTGIMVKANTTGESVTFVKGEETTRATNAMDITIAKATRNANTIDRARINFSGDSQLSKFFFNENSCLYIPQNGEDFAVVAAQNEGELPVNFKAEKNGTYTITVNTENVEANYLHLIDNLTGMDTDLLSTPSYTFNAKTSDYASRFKLVFGVKNDNEEMSQASSFAYINNGEMVISNEGRATLQVIDVLGRIVSSEEINGEARISTNGMTAGVYVLNLNGNVQKIVVR